MRIDQEREKDGGLANGVTATTEGVSKLGERVATNSANNLRYGRDRLTSVPRNDEEIVMASLDRVDLILKSH